MSGPQVPEIGCSGQPGENCRASRAFSYSSQMDTGEKRANQQQVLELVMGGNNNLFTPDQVSNYGPARRTIDKWSREAPGQLTQSDYAASGSGLMGFGDCGCDSDYVDTGCGCDCNPRGYNWNKPTGGCMRSNMLLIILLLIVVGVVVYYCMRQKL